MLGTLPRVVENLPLPACFAPAARPLLARFSPLFLFSSSAFSASSLPPTLPLAPRITSSFWSGTSIYVLFSMSSSSGTSIFFDVTLAIFTTVHPACCAAPLLCSAAAVQLPYSMQSAASLDGCHMFNFSNSGPSRFLSNSSCGASCALVCETFGKASCFWKISSLDSNRSTFIQLFHVA